MSCSTYWKKLRNVSMRPPVNLLHYMIICYKIHHMTRDCHDKLEKLYKINDAPSQINCCLPWVVLQYINTKLGVLRWVCFTHFSTWKCYVQLNFTLLWYLKQTHLSLNLRIISWISFAQSINMLIFLVVVNWKLGSLECIVLLLGSMCHCYHRINNYRGTYCWAQTVDAKTTRSPYVLSENWNLYWYIYIYICGSRSRAHRMMLVVV